MRSKICVIMPLHILVRCARRPPDCGFFPADVEVAKFAAEVIGKQQLQGRTFVPLW